MPGDAEPTQDSRPVEILLGCAGYEPFYVVNGKTYQLAILAVMTQLDSGMTAEEWNTKSDDERGALIDAQIEKLRATAPN